MFKAVYKVKENISKGQIQCQPPVCKAWARASGGCIPAFPLGQGGMLPCLPRFLRAWMCVFPSAVQAFIVPGR